MTRLRLLILSFSPIASDARVLKQLSLLRSDFEVTTCGYGIAAEGVADHVEVPADLPVWRYPRPLVMTRQYRRAYWGNAAIAFARTALASRNFDIVLANDVETVGLALELQPALGIHADLHEYSPRQHEELVRFRLFVRPFVEWMCRTFVRRADSWTTVSGGLAREYERKFGFSPEIVTNAAPYVDLAPTPVGSPIRLVHSGACLRHRRLDIMLDAMAQTTARVTLDLFLTPNDGEYLAELKRIAETDARVSVNDPVPYSDLVATLNQFDIGIFVLPPTTFNYAWALPNKMFDYIQARLGSLIGPSPEMADYVERFHLGAIARDFTSQALAALMDALDGATVMDWKRSAHLNSAELSGEQQLPIWRSAIDALVTSASKK